MQGTLVLRCAVAIGGRNHRKKLNLWLVGRV